MNRINVFDQLLNVQQDNLTETKQTESSSNSAVQQNPIFDIRLFERELYSNSHNRKYKQQYYSTALNAYDLLGCIRAAIFKYRKTPVESYADKWLPIMLRAEIGSAIHKFIQDNTNQLTEKEVYLKVPSIYFSGRIDGLIGQSTLVEIKSCTYDDYRKILNSLTPRSSDFVQTIIYKYVLENYCQEIKEVNKGREGINLPKYDNYSINKIQYIYVAHDIISADVSTINEAIKIVSDIKKMLQSKRNKFFFITSLVIDTGDQVTDHVNYVRDIIETCKTFIESNKMPPKDHKYVDTSKCFFCIYQQICNREN